MPRARAQVREVRSKKTLKLFEEARAPDGLGLAAQCIRALAANEESTEATVGAALVAEGLALFRTYMTKGSKTK